LQLGPWPGYTGSPIDADQIPVRELTGGEGQVRGNAQGLTAVSGVAGVEAERGCGGVSRAKPKGRRSSEVDSVPMVGVPKGGRGVARKLLWDDVVLLVLLVGVEGLCSVGSTARPSGGGA
jgi:hypothetical protein